MWGGDAGCAHEWGAERIEKLLHDGYGTSPTSTLGPKGQGLPNNARPTWTDNLSRGAWCTCGAWYGALGLEPTPELYVAHMVAIFREVRRVLRRDGTLWLNLGDSYAASTVGAGGQGKQHSNRGSVLADRSWQIPRGLKPKDLVGIPWMVAFALRADGWYLRSDIIWHKPNPMPESVTDRPTKSHEYLFLLTKSERYYYDADAIREEAIHAGRIVKASDPDTAKNGQKGQYGQTAVGFTQHDTEVAAGRNKRTVWTIATRPYPGAHFATFPEELVNDPILAGTSPKACGVCGAPWERVTAVERDPSIGRGGQSWTAETGQRDSSGGLPKSTRKTLGWRSMCKHEDDTGACVVLDPFNGSGTTGRVSIRHGRSYVGLDISREYLVEQASERVDNIQHVMGL